MVFSFAIILFAIFALGFSAYYRFKYILIQEVNQSVQRVARESADHLSYYIDQFLEPLIALSEDTDIKSMNWENQKQVISYQIIPTYLNVAVVDTDGYAHYMDDTTLDLSDRDYIIDALSGKISFSEIIISRKTGENVIMVGVPIFDDDKIQGALIARLDVDFLKNYAFTRGYKEHGRAYIISDEGTFVSRPETESENSLDYNLYKLAEQDNKYASLATFVKQTLGVNNGYGEYDFLYNKVLMGFASVEGTNWKIYIGTYENEALSALVGLRRLFIGIMIPTMLLSLVAVTFFVNRFSKSIIELDHLFEQGALGNLTIRFTPRTKDEIGRVGMSFNRMMDKIKTLTQYDPLTALLNQYVLEKDIDVLVHDDKFQDFTLIMVAIDRFSFINEAYGYPAGDAVLCEVAKRIASCSIGPYSVYRYKGDEFVVLSKEIYNEYEIYQRTQNILSRLMESYQYNGKVININVNIGVFTWSEETRAENPLKAVTQAKNYAKYMGSNQIQKFDEHIYRKLNIMIELQGDIITGIKENQFFLVFQPLFFLRNEEIAEIEVLIRWNHPEKGLLYPDQFIELAEQAGTIVNIDYWVLEAACKQLQTWKVENRAPVILSVNISSKTFETKSFIPDLTDIMARYAVDPTLIQLEITERIVIKNVEESIIKLKELRNMGIHVAIDDFGIGYSSLSYIVRLPIDSIKIDKAFVQSINNSQESKAIVATIINLCKILNFRVIAEGIENKIELDYLRSNMCDIGQGYYYSKPISIGDIENRYF